MRVIKTFATAKRVPAGEVVKRDNVIVIVNEGQSCMALVPRWGEWGAALEDGTRLVEGQNYRITIEVDS